MIERFYPTCPNPRCAETCGPGMTNCERCGTYLYAVRGPDEPEQVGTFPTTVSNAEACRRYREKKRMAAA